ncbi:MAG: LytTR family DNA-binding domain-containing protein [Sediminibacterium sp.]|nr:LytTR family DNA-binding domain-containing protein [Sediminibacterium sp.]
MFKINCIIIEDEPLAVKNLVKYISQVSFLELQQTFKNAILASEYLQNTNADLIFLDIHLPKLKGLDFLKTLTNSPHIIVTTAYQQYAVEGFNLNVTDYLLKPFGFERFLVAVNKVRKAHSEKLKTDDSGKTKDFIFLNVQKKKVKILFSEIVYIESQRAYIKIITIKNEFISKMTTQEMEELLPENLFKRIHRSYIVSINKIESYTSEMVQVNGIPIPIGREYRDIIKKL